MRDVQFSVLMVLLVLCLVCGGAGAADKYWSGTGTWVTDGAGQWSATSGSGYGTATWSNGDNAIFEGLVGAVILAEPITVKHLHFAVSSSGYTMIGQHAEFLGWCFDNCCQQHGQPDDHLGA